MSRKAEARRQRKLNERRQRHTARPAATTRATLDLREVREWLGMPLETPAELREALAVQVGDCVNKSRDAAAPLDLLTRYFKGSAEALFGLGAVALTEEATGYAYLFWDTLARVYPTSPWTALIAELLSRLKGKIEEMGGSDFVVQLEEVVWSLEKGEKAALEQALGLTATANIPALRQLARAFACVGHVEKSAELTRTILESHPDDPQALADLVWCSLMSGQSEQARSVSLAFGFEGYANQIGALLAFSLLGDDEAVLRAPQDALGECPLADHLRGVALGRLGRWSEAQEKWQSSLAREPEVPIVKDNLENSHRAIGQRNSPWAFGFERWLSPQQQRRIAQRFRDDDSTRLPDMRILAPILLDRGDPHGMNLAFRWALLDRYENVEQALQGFVLGHRGPDASRREALRSLVAEGRLPLRVRIFQDGKPREILAFPFEVSALEGRDASLQEVVDRAVQALDAGNHQDATDLLEPLTRRTTTVDGADFSTLCESHIRLARSLQNRAEAVLWSEAWEEAEKTSPELERHRPQSLRQPLFSATSEGLLSSLTDRGTDRSGQCTPVALIPRSARAQVTGPGHAQPQ